MAESYSEFAAAKEIAENLKRCFIAPLLSYRFFFSDNLSVNERGSVLVCPEQEVLAAKFRYVEVPLKCGKQSDNYSCGLWASAIVLAIAMDHQRPGEIDFTFDPSQQSAYLH